MIYHILVQIWINFLKMWKPLQNFRRNRTKFSCHSQLAPLPSIKCSVDLSMQWINGYVISIKSVFVSERGSLLLIGSLNIRLLLDRYPFLYNTSYVHDYSTHFFMCSFMRWMPYCCHTSVTFTQQTLFFSTSLQVFLCVRKTWLLYLP